MRRERTWLGLIVVALAAVTIFRGAGATPVDWSELLDEDDPPPSATAHLPSPSATPSAPTATEPAPTATERTATPTEPRQGPTRVEPYRPPAAPRPRAERRPETRRRTREPEPEFPRVAE